MSSPWELAELDAGGDLSQLTRLAKDRPRCRALDEFPVSSWNAPLMAAAGTLCAHGALVLLATWLGLRQPRPRVESVPVTQMMEVDLTPPPPKPVVPEEHSPDRLTEPSAKAPVPRMREPKLEAPKPPTQAAPPPAAAEAAQVLTQESPVADVGEAIVVGNAAVHAGGTSEAGGTATHAVHDLAARAGGVEAGTGRDLAADRSRQPALAGGFEWDCPFPEEAEDEGIDDGHVTLRVEVGADGSVLEVQVQSDPGYGFGREAKRCALRKRWVAGLDRAGLPTRSAALVRVKFER
ncbi:MAG: energy transducer TonB [Myxococcales bacterium]